MYCGVCFTNVSAQCTSNILTNASFELPAQNDIGDNLTNSSSFNGWNIPENAQFNIVRVNGSVYGEGPDTAQDGNQYADIGKADGSIQQAFVLSCPSTINFSGYFSRREAGGNDFSSYIEILDAGGTVVSTSSVVTFTINENQELWKQVTGTAFLPAGNYTFSFVVNNFANCDNAFLCVTPSCALPLKLSLFEGVVNNCTNVLNWKSESEENVKQYEVEYSENGINYVKAGEVVAINNISGANYHFTHTAAVNEKNFYRLKMVDKNGSFIYSKQVIVKNNCAKKAFVQMLSVNPVKDIVQLAVSGLQTNSSLIIYNAHGNKVDVVTINNGIHVLDMNKFASGIYFFKIKTPVGTEVLRISKL